jgi:hypothetical protein
VLRMPLKLMLIAYHRNGRLFDNLLASGEVASLLTLSSRGKSRAFCDVFLSR